MLAGSERRTPQLVDRRGVNRSGSRTRNELRQMVEGLVSCLQNQVVLQDEGGDPHVVRRDGCAPLPQLTKHRCVVMCRLYASQRVLHAPIVGFHAFVAGNTRGLQHLNPVAHTCRRITLALVGRLPLERFLPALFGIIELHPGRIERLRVELAAGPPQR